MTLLHFVPGCGRLYAPLVMAAVLCATVSGAALPDLNIYERDGRIICGNGSKEYRDSLVVLRLQGTALERGYQYGRLMRADILEAAAFWNNELPAFALHAAPQSGAEAVASMHLQAQILPNLISQLPADAAAELQGMEAALGGRIGFRRLAAMQAVCDLYQYYKGVTVGVLRPATRSGVMLVGRNIDSFGQHYLGTRRVVTFCRPDTGLPYATVNPPGMVGATDGMNNAGLVACFTPLPVLEPSLADEILHYDGIPVTVLLRRVLQFAPTLDEAVRILRDAPRTRGGVVFVADPAAGRQALVEFTPDGCEVYEDAGYTLWATDHFRSPRFAEALYRMLGTSYLERYRTRDAVVRDALADAAGFMDLDGMVRLLRRKNSRYLSEMAYLDADNTYSSVRTTGSLVFMPGRKRFWVAGTRYLPAPANRYTGFSLEDEFGDGTVPADDVEPVPPADRVAGPVFAGVQEAVHGDSLRAAGAYRAAVRAYERALALLAAGAAENILAVREKLADTRREAGDFQGAFNAYAALGTALADEPSTIGNRERTVRVLVKTGELYRRVGLDGKAREQFRRALAVRDIYSDRWQERARTYLEGADGN